MQPAQALRAQVRHPQAGHPSLLNQIGQALQQRQLLPGEVAGRAPVQLHEIELALQAQAGRLEGRPVAATTQAPGEGSQFGGHCQRLAAGGLQGGAEATQQALAAAMEMSGAVGVGGVEEQQSPLHGAPEAGLQLGVLIRVVAPEKLIAPGPRAHTDARCGGHIGGVDREGSRFHGEPGCRRLVAMIGPVHPIRAPMASGAAHSIPGAATAAAAARGLEAPAAATQAEAAPLTAEPILCGHCGRTASNGISCQGMCVADSGY